MVSFDLPGGAGRFHGTYTDFLKALRDKAERGEELNDDLWYDPAVRKAGANLPRAVANVLQRAPDHVIEDVGNSCFTASSSGSATGAAR